MTYEKAQEIVNSGNSNPEWHGIKDPDYTIAKAFLEGRDSILESNKRLNKKLEVAKEALEQIARNGGSWLCDVAKQALQEMESKE